jgi:hypothetical protein
MYVTEPFQNFKLKKVKTCYAVQIAVENINIQYSVTLPRLEVCISRLRSMEGKKVFVL